MKSQIWKGVECVRYLTPTHAHICSLASELLQTAKPISPITENQACFRLSIFSKISKYLIVGNVSSTLHSPVTIYKCHHRHLLSFSSALFDRGCDRHGDESDFPARFVSDWPHAKKETGLVHEMSPWRQRSEYCLSRLTDNIRLRLAYTTHTYIHFDYTQYSTFIVT